MEEVTSKLVQKKKRFLRKHRFTWEDSKAAVPRNRKSLMRKSSQMS
jgi:hypothetical protein